MASGVVGDGEQATCLRICIGSDVASCSVMGRINVVEAISKNIDREITFSSCLQVDDEVIAMMTLFAKIFAEFQTVQVVS